MAWALAAAGSKRTSVLNRSASFRFSPCRSTPATRDTPSVNSATAAATRMGTMVAAMVLAGGGAAGRLVDESPQEQVGREPDAAVLDAVGALGADPGHAEPPGGVAVDVDARL